tara:strand:+ start:421 stop:762 length:342 start_codon:yes stop_codon:yes gene_type:complete
MLYKFKNLSEADFIEGDIFGGEVEYEGEIYKFRYYDGFDEAEPYEEASVLISGTWKNDHKLCDLIIAACSSHSFYNNLGDFSVGEILEINEDELVTDYSTHGYPSDQPCITNF